MRPKKIPSIHWLVTAVFLAVIGGCSHHFYKPLKGEFYNPEEFNLVYESVFFNTPDGEKLHGWFIPARKQPARGTVLYLHGNSANMTNYLFYVAFLAEEGYNLMMFDYRGFGESTGEPTAEGLQVDSQAALDYVRSRREVNPDRIVIYGQSLGGAVAITLAGSGRHKGISAVIAEAAFVSYRDLAEEKMEEVAILKWFNGIAATLFVDDTLAPRDYIRNIAPVPMLIVHGTDDRVVPYANGQQLFEKARQPKEFWTIEGGRHIQMLSKYRSIYRPRLLAYLASRFQLPR